ncbi:MAG: diguanylate cyclase domain-containing protein [Candidatus Dormibacteria bacterium]
MTQLLVLVTMSVHFAFSYLYRHGPVAIPPFVTIPLELVPIAYAAVRFGLRGSLPTALWIGVLLLPRFIFLDSGVLRWGDASMLVLLIAVAVAAGRMVDLQRSATARSVEAARLRGIARVADQLPDGVCLTDPAGIITYANPAWAKLQGLASSSDGMGQSLAGFHGGGSLDHGQLPFQDQEGRRRSVVPHQLPDGRRYWADVAATPLLNEQGDVIGRLSTVRDVTQDREAAEALSEAEERFRLTFERAPLGMATITPEGRFLQVNDALGRMLGRSAAELLELGVLGLTPPEDQAKTERALRQRGEGEQFVKRMIHKQGHLVSAQVTVSLMHHPDGEPWYFIAQYQDITEEQRQRERLVQQAFHDPLTGLPNRLLLEDRLGQALARTRRQRHRVAVLFCDLDDFKAVNDRLGHQIGDDVLCMVAARLQGSVRDIDTVARIGGDEFVVLLNGVADSTEAAAAAARIRDTVRQPCRLGEEEVSTRVSIGVAISSGATSTAEALMREADSAMYLTKTAGGDNFQDADPKAAGRSDGAASGSVSPHEAAAPAQAAPAGPPR